MEIVGCITQQLSGGYLYLQLTIKYRLMHVQQPGRRQPYNMHFGVAVVVLITMFVRNGCGPFVSTKWVDFFSLHILHNSFAIGLRVDVFICSME